MKTALKTSLFFGHLVFLFCFGITSMSYGQAVISVDPPENASPGVGSQLTIRLKISGAQNVAGYEVSVNFDTTALQYILGANGDYLPTALFSGVPHTSEGKVTLTGSAIETAQASSGLLATVTFSVVAVKASELQLAEPALWDTNGNPVAVSVRSGSVVESDGPTELKSDVNGDGLVNVLDLALVAKFLRTSDATADANGDGKVNVLDLVLVAQSLGETVGTTLSVPEEGMVLIPAGEFQMGSDDDEAQDNEQPVHTVYVDAFYIDKYEVTNLDYKRFVLANPQWQQSRIPSALKPVYIPFTYLNDWNGNNYPSNKANHPVRHVGWYGAMAYAKWAGKRLPTEAEWEKAARGGKSHLKYPWGNTIDSSKANYNQHVNDTTAVGKYTANGYGLYDMSGNVWEWCLDEYNANFYSVSPAQNPLSGADSIQWLLDNYTKVKTYRVLRGGSHAQPDRALRISHRRSTAPWDTFNGHYGFRCVKSVTP